MKNIEKWIPNNKIPQYLLSLGLFDNGESLIFTFETDSFRLQTNEIRKINIVFDSKQALSYIQTYDTAILKQFSELDDKDIETLVGWNLFKIKDSSYLRWFSEESLGAYNNVKIHHYLFNAYDVVTEVLSLSEPKIEIL